MDNQISPTIFPNRSSPKSEKSKENQMKLKKKKKKLKKNGGMHVIENNLPKEESDQRKSKQIQHQLEYIVFDYQSFQTFGNDRMKIRHRHSLQGSQEIGHTQ